MNKQAKAEQILEQVLVIRDTGLTNMFDTYRVMEIAQIYGYKQLVKFINEHKQEYCQLILHGDIGVILKCL